MSKLSLHIALMAVLLLMPAVLTAQEKIVFQSQRDGNSEIYIMNPDGSNQFPLAGSSVFDGEPTLSPAGDKIAFSSYRDGNSEIYIMNTNGSDQTNLTNNPAYDGQPAFSPDGSRIVFASMRGNHVGIWTMNVDGSNPIEMIEGFGGTDPAYSPDGRQIVFSGLWGTANSSEVWVMDANGLNSTNLSRDDNAEDSEPSFSPDGTQIVFTKNVHGIAGGEIMVMNADGTKPINVTNDPANDYGPSFSPSGRFITFTSLRDGNADIYVMNADGTNPINMSRNAGLDERPMWGTVANMPPILTNVYVPSPIPEGGTATLTGEILDDDVNDTFTLDISWGDGQSDSMNFLGPTFFLVTHVYADDPPAGSPTDEYTVSITVSDQHSGVVSTSTLVTVNNVNPIIFNTDVTPTSVPAGGTVTLHANYTDPGYHGSPSDEDLRAFINWGDGQAIVVTTGRPEAISLPHQYSAAGNYTISIQVTDNDGGVTDETLGVVVTAASPPATPANFRVVSVGTTWIQLAWTDVDNETGFAIERCSKHGCANFAEVVRTEANATAYLDSNLLNNTEYSYRLRAYNSGGMSAYTNVVSGKTLRR